MREFLKLPRQPQRVAAMPGFERGQFHFRFLLVMQRPRAAALVLGGGEGAVVVNALRALGHGHDAEIGSAPAAAPDGLGDLLDAVGNLRNQNHIRATGNARAQRQPARAMSHDLGDNDAVMAVRRAVEPVNRIGGDVERRGKTEG